MTSRKWRRTTYTEPIAEVAQKLLRRLRRLQIQFFADLCAYSQLLEAIERELPHADGDSRERMVAERDEIRWLQGHYDAGAGANRGEL